MEEESGLKHGAEQLFHEVADYISSRLGSESLPRTMQIQRPLVHAIKHGHWQTSVQAESINILAIPQIATKLAPWLPDAQLIEVRSYAAKLADSARDSLPFWATFSGRPIPVFTASQNAADPKLPQFNSDPAGWVERTIVLPALQYHLASIPSVAEVSESDATAFANDVLRVAHDNKLRYRLKIFLSGARLPPGSQYESKNVIFRRASDLDRGAWLAERGGIQSLMQAGGDIAIPDSCIELAFSSDRSEQFQFPTQLVASAIGSFQLNGALVAGNFCAVQSDPSWLLMVQSSVPLMIPGRVDSYTELTEGAFSAIISDAERLARHQFTAPRSSQDLALHRFFAGIARQGISDLHPGGADRNAVDAVLDFTIALEALLLPYDRNVRHSDLSYRFRMHGAHLLTAAGDERSQTVAMLREIYETRSRLVHGGNYPASDAIQKARDDARELARRGLLRAVREGFPTAETFTRMLLGDA